MAKKENCNQQELLLPSREDGEQKIYNALLHIGRLEDVAHRIGVANLGLDDVKLLDSYYKPERKFKLRP